MSNIFSCGFWHLHVFFGKCLCRSSAHFKIRLFVILFLSHMGSLYTLNTNRLFNIWFANIITHSVGCLIVLLMVSFDMQNYFVWSHPIYFCFCFPCVWSQNHKNIANICVSEIIDYVFSRNFIASGLTFKSLIHFEFMFVYGVR